MGILISKDTKAIVQGITGKQGSYHTNQMLAYGTKIVAGVVPSKGGSSLSGVPVYDTVKEKRIGFRLMPRLFLFLHQQLWTRF